MPKMSRDSNVNPYPHIPAEFQSLLLEFTVEYLMEKPGDILDFAVDYFTRIRDKQTGRGVDGRTTTSAGCGGGEETTTTTTITTTNTAVAVATDHGWDDAMLTDDEDEPMLGMCQARAEEIPEVDAGEHVFWNAEAGHREHIDCDEAPPTRSCGRRKSVFAEHYNPEEDDDDDVAKAVFPKTDKQRQRLSEAVRDIFLFRSLDQEQMQEVLDAMFERTVSSDEFVIVQGDDGDNFYVIQSGTYEIYVIINENEKKLVGKYENHGSFGELALLYNMPRAATIQAMTDGSLWAMDRQTFRRILLKNAFKKRKMYEALLENVPMLKQLEAYERMNLADALYPRTFDDGQIIIKQGDAADGMYFIEDGTVVCSMVGEKETVEREVSRINKGGYFGELALVTHKPRAASVYAVGRVKLAFLDVQAFERLLGPCMDIMKRNIDDYEEEIVKIFGSKTNLSFAR